MRLFAAAVALASPRHARTRCARARARVQPTLGASRRHLENGDRMEPTPEIPPGLVSNASS